MNYFVKANPNRCIGCRTCVISCVVAHEGRQVFELDPDGYNFNPRLFVVKTAQVSAPIHCRHCENPACLTSCTSGAIYLEDHRVVINSQKCIGCKNCLMACPFGAVELVATGEIMADGSPKRVAHKCDLCARVADSPCCVKVCLTDALELVTEDDLRDNILEKRRSAVASTMI